MKTIIHAAVLVAIVSLTSCSGGAGKFTGKWREVNGGDNSKVLVIEKKGEKYDMYPEARPEKFVSMDYDAAHDMLTMTQGREMLDVRYNNSTKHLMVGDRGDNDITEFERIK